MGWRAQNVDRVIRMTEQLVSALDRSQADLAPARDALKVAKSLYTDHDYSEAVAQAKRAETLATSLNERFDAYVSAWKALQASRDELERLGFPTEDLERVVGAAEEVMMHRVDEDNTTVPDYVGATRLLEGAMQQVRETVDHARLASREILLASVAVEALSEFQADRTPSWLALRLEELVEQSTRELALGNVVAAQRLASEAKRRADEARAGDVRAKERLEQAAYTLEELSAAGPAVERLEEQLESTRTAFAKTILDATTTEVVVDRVSTEVAFFADHYSQACGLLDHAERVYAELQREGFFSYEVDAALVEARRVLGIGDWAGVTRNVRRATECFVRRRKEREALAESLADIHERVKLLEDVRLPLLPDIQDLLARASEEFQGGRFSGASEDLFLANVLMRHATRSGSA
jgi:hypothetical protein